MTIATTSPAYNRERIPGPNSLVEMPWCGKITLRLNPENSRTLKKMAAVLGVELPLQATTVSSGVNVTVYWMGPNEWLVHCGIGEVSELMEKLSEVMEGIHHAVVDVSDYYTVLKLEGPDAAALLARGCPLDLDSTVFESGACAQTRFGHASVLLHKAEDASSFRIQVRWSYTEYVWDYIASATRGLG